MSPNGQHKKIMLSVHARVLLSISPPPNYGLGQNFVVSIQIAKDLNMDIPHIKTMCRIKSLSGLANNGKNVLQTSLL